MTRDEYERMRRLLEEQLQAEVAWLYEAHRIRLRALDAVWSASSALPEAAGRLVLSVTSVSSFPQALPQAPAPPPEPRRPAKARAWSVSHAVEDALDRVGEVFDKDDLLAALDFEPRRATFYNAMTRLRHKGLIEVVEYESGRQPMLYRKLTPKAAAKP